jgi:hypothetical protein
MTSLLLLVPDPDLRALASGEQIVAFVAHGIVTAGSTVTIAGSGPRIADELKPAYRRWAGAPAPRGRWTAAVDAVLPASQLDNDAGAARHILRESGTGDLVVLRVAGPDGPVLTDDAYSARRISLESALQA